VLIVIGKVTDHLVRDEVLAFRTAGASGIASRMKDDLAVCGYLLLQGRSVDPQYGGKSQRRLWQAARRGKWQRCELVLAVQLVDLLIGVAIGRMLDLELIRVGGWLGLAEDRVAHFGRTGVVVRFSLRCWFRLALLWFAGHPVSPMSTLL